MTLPSHKTHKNYLLVTALVIGGFGPVFGLASMEATSEPARWTLDLLSWPIDDAQDYGAPTTRFLSALTGGFLLGWGVTILALRAWVFDLAPEGVRRTILTGTAAWFLLDSAGSIASGNPSNAVFNVVVAALVVGPLALPAQSSGAGATTSTTAAITR